MLQSMTDDTIKLQVERILNTIRPAIIADGGNIQFVSYKDGVVSVKLSGACVGCPASSYTMKLGVEQALTKELSFVHTVQAVEDDEY